MFFLSCRLFRPGAAHAFAMLVLSLLTARLSIINSSAVAFFCGGLAYCAFAALEKRGSCLAVSAACALTVVAWVVFWPLAEQASLTSLVDQVRARAQGSMPLELAARAFEVVLRRIRELVLFPALVFTIAFLESATPSFFAWTALGRLGNLSYAIYLLHYPLQFVFFLFATWTVAPANFFAGEFVFVLYIAVLLAISAVTFRWIERPAMAALRSGGGKSG